MTKKVYAPGVYDLTSDEYHGSAGISRSGIMEFRKTPKHFHHKYINPDYKHKPSTDAMKFGSALHCYVLEPEKFAQEYYITENFDKRTTVGKLGYARSLVDNAGKIGLEQDEFSQILAMANSLLANHDCAELIKGAKYEKSIYWQDPDTGILCKARPDIWHPKFIVDLKTTMDASPREFQRSFYNYGYHLQIAMLSEAVKHTQGTPITSFIDLAVEKTEPYCTAIYLIDETALQHGLDEFHHYLARIKECMDTNTWPSYSTMTINLPSWAKIGE